MTILIPNLAIAGYRSFGRAPQYFDRFAKVNIFIGQNNAGKSNVLRFLHEIYPQLNKHKHDPIKLDPLANHLPDRPPILLGVGDSVELVKLNDWEKPALPRSHRILTQVKEHDRARAVCLIAKLLVEKARIDETTLCWTLWSLPDRGYDQNSWFEAVKVLKDQELRNLCELMTGWSDSDRTRSWEPQVIEKLLAPVPVITAQLVPAIRQIGVKGTTSDAYDGNGIIDRVAMLQNPDVHNRESRKTFDAIQGFLRDVLDRPDAKIEVPYQRDTINVHMDGKFLPVESLGSGIHEVLILAAAATTLTNTVICIEEPELHLNPILQKKLIRYLSNNTENQYFITTHSAALMDTPEAEIYHIRLDSGCSIVERATSDEHRSAVCEDLGYHPSDLLQANCLIWVEGPSDRIYLNWWIENVDPELIEGIHYSVMFYGGRLASHLSMAPDSDEVKDFIALRRLNRRGVMLIDSDRDSAHKKINATKGRLKKEFDLGPGHAWVTEGREIENYLPTAQLKVAFNAVHPSAMFSVDGDSKYKNLLVFKNKSHKPITASKVEIARHICKVFKPDFSLYDLKQRIQTLQKFIWDSNPKVGTLKKSPKEKA